MHNLKKLIGGFGLVILLSACKHEAIPDIVSVGDCEHGIVAESQLIELQKIFPEAKRADVLISGGCYQLYLIKQHHELEMFH